MLSYRLYWLCSSATNGFSGVYSKCFSIEFSDIITRDLVKIEIIGIGESRFESSVGKPFDMKEDRYCHEKKSSFLVAGSYLKKSLTITDLYDRA